MANTDTGSAAGNVFRAPPADRLLNEHEAARVLSLSVKTLRRWRWAGRPPSFVKLGASVRYDLGTLRDFIAAGHRKSTSDTGEAAP